LRFPDSIATIAAFKVRIASSVFICCFPQPLSISKHKRVCAVNNPVCVFDHKKAADWAAALGC
jgi:hypothetical protein